MVKVASFTKDGRPIKEKFWKSADLEYCFDYPTNWKQVIYTPSDIHFSGWAISLDKSPINITIFEDNYPSRTIHPEHSRPDVKEHLAKLGKQVDDHCGFEFDLSINEVPKGEKIFTIEITNDTFSSGPIEFIVSRFGSMQWPKLENFTKPLGQQRSDYKSTWNALSKNEDEAKFYIAGSNSEEAFEQTAESTKTILLQTVGVHKDDVVLEIGCGIGRMAPALAPICKKWIGTDVSENMLDFARKRTSLYPNVEFISINGWDLSPIQELTVDIVYCTVVFMHLDEWERYNYICEAWRVLRPGGRLYVDNFNLRSQDGWKVFMENFLAFHPMERPSHISKSSTPEELQVYFERAGFEKINQSEADTWIRSWGIKP